VIVDGGGMLARAFVALGRAGGVGALVFARGVADSRTEDEAAYERELGLLAAAIDRARAEDLRLVYFSGAPIYGSFDGPVRETDAVRPRTRYGRHQAICEERIRAAGIHHLILRVPNAVGPVGNDAQLVPSLVRQVRAGSVAVQTGAGRDLIDVDDLARLTATVVGRTDESLTLNMASGICRPVGELVDAIVGIVGREPVRRSIDGGEAQHFDVARLEAVIGPLGFPDSYPFEVLATRVPSIAAAQEPSSS
jgi:nucleoside-diphosphate-sugar epimerase